MNTQDKIRQNIRDIREDKNLTQADMAERLSMSVTGYAKLERGENNISIERLHRIAQILEVEVFDLMTSGSEGVLVFNNSHDNFSNSSNFSLALGNPALEAEIKHLNYIINAKNELLDAREREIDSLKQQITVLQKVITTLENNKESI
ncbi:helix-turn-helix transcriptional regulator [Pelistega sp. NLN82]|uniref:Helix-turn-helix transcriptional regulator n=1 Tax=Pelistega ratti TaxID=2652177 RepID=A0A6L9Y8D2_9BURK|nr:helix-turn-helix transcriptional regulator [Pelistega ratti]NEN76553.1 helix-turn-helix transcriptional regulator [Pelistega ratti]